MFVYFEGYHPRVWQGLEQRGLIRKNTGLRFCQNRMLTDELKFNRLAALGGEFDRIQRELDCPMYIDRLQGGCHIDDYPYDETLLDGYRSRLGDKFWGFQMHEWMSNYRSDIDKLAHGDCPAWTKEAIRETIFRLFPGKHLFLEAMLPEEMEALGRPQSAEEFCRHARWLYENRLSRYAELIPCDSAYQAWKLELEAPGGRTRRFMPEVGAQTPNTRLQIGYARGMAKAYGAQFGVYYEPWGGDPFSACCYNRCPADNEWGIGQSADFPFQTMGENGGSSRSLQRRVHLYGYFAGAAFMSEEWGMCNTFYDWQDFEISPYGQVKKDFLDLTEKYPDPGKTMTPVAVVLPKKMNVLEAIQTEGTQFGYPLAANDPLNGIRRDLRAIFAADTPMRGTEKHALINSQLPDAFDLIHSDAKTLGDYRYLVDLSGGEIPAAYRNRLVTAQQAEAAARAALPCEVVGSAHWLVNECADGTYRLIAFNHSGVRRSVEKGEYTLPEEAVTVQVSVKNGGALKKREGEGDLRGADGAYTLHLKPGEWLMAEF